ncbi:glycosyltransferase [Isoptericola sp. NPDC057391]|uniref:glycosyltransferase family 2 protein n=1 Tax=Isoptericola sp. NPDC057391 TaxID=3346117 RepID=UPI003629B592
MTTDIVQAATRPRVSIVIPTYCSGPWLDDALESVDAQTLPSEQIEVLLVDDGSPDSTPDRIQELAKTRLRTRAFLLHHTGWPSHGRNTGLVQAHGDYVVFMDHDDVLYPRGLEAAVAMADRTGADVVTGKESRTDQPQWGLDVFAANLDDASRREDGLHALLPTNPHKLYRREFLLDHDVRFPEGRRVLWEDVFFAIDVSAAGARTAVLADVPFYHWVRHGETASSSYRDDLEVWWRWLAEIVTAIDERLDHDGVDYKRLLWHQFSTRVIPGIGARLFARTGDERDAAIGHAEATLARIPTWMDAQLPRHLAARVHLARARRWDLVGELVRVDAGLVGSAETTDVHWDDKGRLVVSTSTRWSTKVGHLALRRHGDRAIRDLPGHLAAAIPPELLDVTDELTAASSTLVIRSRDDAVAWAVPTDAEVDVIDIDGRVAVRVQATAQVDARTAALGHPLEGRVWDFRSRSWLFGVVSHQPLRTETSARVALVDGEPRVAYKNDSGALTLDLGQTKRTVLGSAKVVPTRATTEHRRRGADSYRLPLRGVAVVGSTRIEGGISLQPVERQDATIVGDGNEARIEGTIDAAPGEYRVVGNFGGRDVTLHTIVTVDKAGRLSFRAE